MMVAGLRVREGLVRELAATLLDAGSDDTAAKLEAAVDLGDRTVPLTGPEREEILQVLDDPPDGLEELRAVLLAHQRDDASAGGVA